MKRLISTEINFYECAKRSGKRVLLKQMLKEKRNGNIRSTMQLLLNGMGRAFREVVECLLATGANAKVLEK